MDDKPKSKISVLELARRSKDFASISWTVEDVRKIRPAWDGPEAEYFLRTHETELAHMLLEVGWLVLAALIAAREKEARFD